MEDLFGEKDNDSGGPPQASPVDSVPVSSTSAAGETRPLADRLRPIAFDDFLGQDKLTGAGAPLRQLIESDRIPSMILWGPPGSGKTTLATLIARTSKSDFVTLSAVTSGIKDVRQVIDIAKVNRQYARRTILFIDEIHRFNKAQQDAFLPHVEVGLLVLIGATTENPSFSVIAPLLSRCRVFTLEALRDTDIACVLARGMTELNREPDQRPAAADADALEAIAALCDGDARRALGMLELAAGVARAQPGQGEARVTRQGVQDAVQRHLMFDRQGEEHYNVISALHKTIRSSDPHGALYWCERMLVAGEDPRFILRRLIRAASEDIGLADPRALEHAVACLRAFENLGSPEGDIFVSQLAVYLACAPKSNSIYMASKATRALIEESGTLPVPLHLRNAPTRLMKDLGYAEGYLYDHSGDGHFIAKQGLPDAIEGRKLYEPGTQGAESRIREKLAAWDAKREEERGKRQPGSSTGSN
ncbi:replication-associated recombination protein A [Candidatus Poribacteria bacterium]|nr:replication-associated recombination protein A [Candidatus Poribacteria bacterium]